MVLWRKHDINKHYVSFVPTHKPIASQKHLKFIVIYNYLLIFSIAAKVKFKMLIWSTQLELSD